MPTSTARPGVSRVLMSLTPLLCALLAGAAQPTPAPAQTTSFTYQGQLTEAGTGASGDYDLQFTLFDNAMGGTPIGTTQMRPAVAVTDGVLTVQLDFGVNAFPGANRFVEVSVRRVGGGSFTTLAPRQQISSSPYAIRTLSAATADALSSTCVGCVTDAHVQSVAGSKVSGAIPVASVPAGSSNYIQNTTTPQAGVNFNVGGNGTVGGMLGVGTSTPASKLAVRTATGLYGFTHTDGTITIGSYVGSSSSGANGGWLGTQSNHQLHLFTNNGQPSLTIDTMGNVGIGTTSPSTKLEVDGTINATTQYDLGDSRILSAPGGDNVFVGHRAGQANTTGARNAFVGFAAGEANSLGSFNTFIGTYAGEANTTGARNTFVGDAAGEANTTGGQNSFFGQLAGVSNTEGLGNTFVGGAAGQGNTTGLANTFLGGGTGRTNTTGNGNTVVGITADVGANNLTNATAIGAQAQVDQSNALVLGSIAGVNGAETSTNVGIGTTTPQTRLHVKGDVLVETSGSGGNIQFGTPNTETGMTFIERVGTTTRADVRFDGSTLKLVAGIGAGPPGSTTGIAISTAGIVGIGVLGGAGTDHLCRNASQQIATCSSSLRYKQQIAPYRAGLDLIDRLRPISFSWKTDGRRDLGLGAEDVATVEPLLVTHNEQGEIEGVKYDHLNVVLINAIKQQQRQIEALQATNAALNARLQVVEQRTPGGPEAAQTGRAYGSHHLRGTQ